MDSADYRWRAAYAAVATTNSMVFEFVSRDNIARNDIVEIMMTTIRIHTVPMAIQIATGASIRNAISAIKSALAVRLIRRPEYMYTFGSVEIL
jgi:hypothetical protein